MGDFAVTTRSIARGLALEPLGRRRPRACAETASPAVSHGAEPKHRFGSERQLKPERTEVRAALIQ
jgi:hypothetical protein